MFLFLVYRFAMAIKNVFIKVSNNHRFLVARWTGLAFLSQSVLILTNPIDQNSFIISTLIFILSFFVFYQSVKVARNKPLSLAYSNDTPKHIEKNGPYAWVRHPFYTSYITSISGATCGIGTFWSFIPLIAAYFIYFKAAKFEEEKFSRSALAKEYEIYKENTGMFIPKVTSIFNLLKF